MKRIAPFLLYIGVFLTAIVLSTLPVSCGTTYGTVDCKDPGNATKAACLPSDVFDCAKAAVTMPALVDVAGTLQSGSGSDWESELANLVVKYGGPIVGCAVRDTLAVLTAQKAPTANGSGGVTAGSGSAVGPPKPSTAQLSPAVVRAQKYLADKKFTQ